MNGGLRHAERAAPSQRCRRGLEALAALSLIVTLSLPSWSAPVSAAAAAAGATRATRATRATTDPVIMAAGDIACDPTDSSYNSGSGTTQKCQQLWTSAQLTNIVAVLPLGDEQYTCGTLSQFNTVYDSTWGKQKAITHPVVGNHEYLTSCSGSAAGAAGYFSYFGAAATPLQPSCTAKCKGYYSYTIGAWHIIALNSECSTVGGCAAGSAQETWLRSDLAADTAKCTLAYWHRPYYSSGQSGGDTSMGDIWTDLFNAHADVVLNGHDHNYQRYMPQDANAVATASGVTEFVVGSGGENHLGFTGNAANVVALNSNTFGVLQLTLHATSYDWKFLADGHSGSFTDAGSAACV